MSEWKTYKLGDVVSTVIDYRGKTPLKLGGDWSSNGYRALSAKNIKTGRIVQEETIRFVDEELYKKWMKEEISRGDIIITSEAPFGEVFYWDSDEKIVLSQRLFGLKINHSQYCAKYIYYYMSSYSFQEELKGRATGTTVIGLRQPELLKCNILCPPLAEQKRIADILSAIDDKIELNRRINANLEQQAQALYKSWFVDNNTNKIRLEEVVKTTSGGTPSRSHTEYYGGNYGWIKSKELNGSFISKTEESITDLAILKSSAKILPEMSVLIAMYGATVGQYAITSKPMTCNQAICALLPNENYPYTYLFMVAKNKKEELINNAVGSAQQNISQVIIKDLLISNDIAKIKEFHNKVAPIFGIIRKNTEENINLSTLRDTLLPKLMSGEITV